MRQRPMWCKMAEVSSEEVLLNAIEKMRNGKARGKSGIFPEMVCCEEEFLNTGEGRGPGPHSVKARGGGGVPDQIAFSESSGRMDADVNRRVAK